MSDASQHAADVYRNAELIYSPGAVEDALDSMARDIDTQLRQRDPLVLCVMTGALIPTGKLLTRLDFPLQIDYVHPTRYDGSTSGGELQWKVPPTVPVEDRVVLIVDDIFDEGNTLTAVVDYCQRAGASEVLTAVLVNKIHTRKASLQPAFVGLEVEDRYVFGCGMDYKGYLRNVAGIFAVRD